MKSKLSQSFSMNFLYVFLFFSLSVPFMATASEKDIYEFSWLDPDKEVFVLQNRKFRKSDRLYVNLGGGMTTSGAFVNATAIQGRLGYFFSENFGFEGMYSKNSGKENDTAAEIRHNSGSGSSTPFRRIVDNYAGAMALWSPFYSKINIFNQILYMDWIFGLGYAQLKESNNTLDVKSGGINKTETSETHGGLMWGAGMNFYLSPSFSIRTDLTAVHYKAISVAGSNVYYSNFDVTAALGYSF